jgi:TrwC relaxase
VVASISARGGVEAAIRYYEHLGHDDYYLRDGTPPGRWAGEGAERLSLSGPVTGSEFEAALNGIDPKLGNRLTALGGRSREHVAGWDMTFSAPMFCVVGTLRGARTGDDRGRPTAGRCHGNGLPGARRGVAKAELTVSRRPGS